MYTVAIILCIVAIIFAIIATTIIPIALIPFFFIMIFGCFYQLIGVVKARQRIKDLEEQDGSDDSTTSSH